MIYWLKIWMKKKIYSWYANSSFWLQYDNLTLIWFALLLSFQRWGPGVALQILWPTGESSYHLLTLAKDPVMITLYSTLHIPGTLHKDDNINQ